MASVIDAIAAEAPCAQPGHSAPYTPGPPCLSPLRYPGGKRRLLRYVAHTLAANGLRPVLYVEPFAGGASVALQLLCDGVVDTIGLVDRDPLIAAFWRTVFWETEWLVEQIRTYPVTLDRWHLFRRVSPRDRRWAGFACLFLNRTSFSGILAPRAGPLGGTRNPDPQMFGCRFPRDTLVRRVQTIAAMRDRVRFIWQLDWHQAIGRIRDMQSRRTLPRNVFYYCDPPFVDKAERLYSWYFKPADHRRLRDALMRMGPWEEPWLLSYDSLPAVQQLYGDAPGMVLIDRYYTTKRLISGRPLFAEAIVTNLPRVPKPRRVGA
jgi:DNA adenine methylase